jgi:hypothetical protein
MAIIGGDHNPAIVNGKTNAAWHILLDLIHGKYLLGKSEKRRRAGDRGRITDPSGDKLFQTWPLPILKNVF